MGIEYKIKVKLPEGYTPSALLGKLPSPIDKATLREVYSYAIEADGFYFVDHLVDDKVASVAFRRLINEALSQTQSVQVVEL